MSRIKMKRFTLSLPPALHQALLVEAETKGIPAAELARRIFENNITPTPNKEDTK